MVQGSLQHLFGNLLIVAKVYKLNTRKIKSVNNINAQNVTSTHWHFYRRSEDLTYDDTRDEVTIHWPAAKPSQECGQYGDQLIYANFVGMSACMISQLCLNPITIHMLTMLQPRGGTDLERGYVDVRPWRPPFHASPAARKGPISSKRVSSQDPLLRKFGNFSLNSLNFQPNFSSQAPKFGNFQLTSPQIWKFSAHKPPNLEIFRSQAPLFRGKCQFASPHFGNPGHTPLPEKKLSAPPRATAYKFK